MRIATLVWRGDSALASLARGALAPVSLLFRGVTSARNALYDRGALAVTPVALPVVAIGNLSVGGTGKTPVSAWVASELVHRGARPAIVLRGYGDDEPAVHAAINPDVPVFANADRVAAVREALAAGADIAVLDDAFQHRRIARMEDVVLVSADQWREPIRVLPAGPWREVPGALSRATFVIVTRKAAESAFAMTLLTRLAPLTRSGRGAVAALEPGDLRDAVTGTPHPLSVIRGTRVLVAAGIGDPESLATQLGRVGAVVGLRSFPDHHVYTSADVARLARDARSFDHMVCTLKDAVKLAPQWPREGPPLWYVSLRCRIEAGVADVSALLDRLLLARSTQKSQAPQAAPPRLVDQ